MAKKTDALAKRPTQAVAKDDRPEWVTGPAEGFEGMTAQDMVLPLLKLCQSLTPQRQKKDPSYIEGLSEGDNFHQITGEILGEGPFHITAVRLIKSRIRWVDPKKMNSGIDCFGAPCPATGRNPEGISCQKNEGGPCIHQEFGEDNPCFITYDAAVLVQEHPEWGAIVMRFRSTGVKVFRTWYSMMKMRNAPIYTMKFSVRSVDASNSKGAFKQWRIDNDGWNNEKMTEVAREAFSALKTRTIVVHDEREREPGEDKEM